ncbi:helix-turn-helix domain-containing protein [Plectonema cf. radiosum LEGE 06105]|uniref:Helix-turn-helix domain-containing protein n=1 Tax=Plectonema cf. radiosum LEGE 06105 TaxID=945769 RepID=A0A8J7FEG0_9CYAN|nr:helix-turn-helix domain-containing protein [Plectonema radiosum]MBE9217219.1 helix-turn-helix domain-containing protein [Plectonema cf. radiosum LEGE 06105]
MPAKIYRVHLSAAERAHLQELIGKRSEKSLQVKRAYILLAADEHGDKQWKDAQISEAYGIGKRTVERLRQRFVEEGLEVALQGKHREVVREKVFDGEVEAKLIALRCSGPPSGYARWTLHLLADKMIELQYVEHISHESVRQLLKKTGLSLGG